MSTFNKGDYVFWSSQASGSSRRKYGQIVEVVPPNKEPTSPLKSSGLPRRHESYVVRASIINGSENQRKMKKLYWPLVKHLEKVGEAPDKLESENPTLELPRKTTFELKDNVITPDADVTLAWDPREAGNEPSEEVAEALKEINDLKEEEPEDKSTLDKSSHDEFEKSDETEVEEMDFNEALEETVVSDVEDPSNATPGLAKKVEQIYKISMEQAMHLVDVLPTPENPEVVVEPEGCDLVLTTQGEFQLVRYLGSEADILSAYRRSRASMLGSAWDGVEVDEHGLPVHGFFHMPEDKPSPLWERISEIPLQEAYDLVQAPQEMRLDVSPLCINNGFIVIDLLSTPSPLLHNDFLSQKAEEGASYHEIEGIKPGMEAIYRRDRRGVDETGNFIPESHYYVLRRKGD